MLATSIATVLRSPCLPGPVVQRGRWFQVAKLVCRTASVRCPVCSTRTLPSHRRSSRARGRPSAAAAGRVSRSSESAPAAAVVLLGLGDARRFVAAGPQPGLRFGATGPNRNRRVSALWHLLRLPMISRPGGVPAVRVSSCRAGQSRLAAAGCGMPGSAGPRQYLAPGRPSEPASASQSR